MRNLLNCSWGILRQLSLQCGLKINLGDTAGNRPLLSTGPNGRAIILPYRIAYPERTLWIQRNIAARLIGCRTGWISIEKRVLHPAIIWKYQQTVIRTTTTE